MKTGYSILLNQKDVWESETTFEKTVLWYKNFYEKNITITIHNVNQYVTDAKIKKIEWAK